MSNAKLVPVERGRVLLSGVELPDPVPTRVYISGRLYRLAPDTRLALPPIANVVKLILNWTGPASRVARNILYVLTGSSFVPSDQAKLKLLADAVHGWVNTSALKTTVHTSWSLQNVTAKDAGGTSAQATSTVAPVAGLASGNALPPQVSMVISWQIAAAYRGGKPRTYMPGVPDVALTTSGGSGITAGFASTLEGNATAFMNAINTGTVTGGGSFTLGTVSYYRAHALRPTPIFEQYMNASVHERLDSQRRRSGKESTFGLIP